MREPENGKRTFEQIEIPEELKETVERAVHLSLIHISEPTRP